MKLLNYFNDQRWFIYARMGLFFSIIILFAAHDNVFEIGLAMFFLIYMVLDFWSYARKPNQIPRESNVVIFENTPSSFWERLGKVYLGFCVINGVPVKRYVHDHRHEVSKITGIAESEIGGLYVDLHKKVAEYHDAAYRTRDKIGFKIGEKE